MDLGNSTTPKEAPMSDKYLGIYLNDHLAVLAGGEELVNRSLESNQGTPLGGFLQQVLERMQQDRQALESLMAEREVAQNWAKTGGAWLAERVGRLKLNGEITGYSPLSRLVEVEGIGLALEARRSFWDTLSEVGISEAGGSQTADLAARAEDEINELEAHRIQAAKEALGAATSVS
jgi:hypothetical protein